jgi:nucleoside-diphosphate-sugar epimerase
MVAKILGINGQQIIYDGWMPGDIKVFDIDNSKIKRELQIEFITNFYQGLLLTIEWAKKYFQKI